MNDLRMQMLEGLRKDGRLTQERFNEGKMILEEDTTALHSVLSKVVGVKESDLMHRVNFNSAKPKPEHVASASEHHESVGGTTHEEKVKINGQSVESAEKAGESWLARMKNHKGKLIIGGTLSAVGAVAYLMSRNKDEKPVESTPAR